MGSIGIFLGFGMGWTLYGVVNLIFSSKRLTRKLEKRFSEYEVEESCRKSLISGILYTTFGIIWLIVALVICIMH